MKIINRQTLNTKEIKDEEVSEYVTMVSSEWVPFTVEDLYVLLRSREEIISEDREDIRRYREALKSIADLHIRGIEDSGANQHRRIAKEALE